MRLIGTFVLFCLSAVPADAADGVFVLVRHAEKVDDSRDPELSASGKERARSLVEVLRDMRVGSVYTTNYVRTRDTVGPLAARLGVEPIVYDGERLEELADKLIRQGGRALVVGHSNTTPKMVEHLGGEPGPPMQDDEYDRLYVVVIEGDRVETLILRYPGPLGSSSRR